MSMRKFMMMVLTMMAMVGITACGAKEAPPAVIETGVIEEDIIVEETIIEEVIDPYEEVKNRLEAEYGFKGGEWSTPLPNTDPRYGNYIIIEKDGTRIWYTFDLDEVRLISTTYAG